MMPPSLRVAPDRKKYRHHPMLKRTIKRFLQSAVATVGPGNLHSPFKRHLVILTYHRILPGSHPARGLEQPGMYVSPETFEMHMHCIRSRFTLMHLSDWLDAAAAGRAPRRAAAVTFDDGWLDNYEYAYPILRHYRVPSTVFIVSDLVGTHYSFWPNRLGRLLSVSGSDGLSRVAGTGLYRRLCRAAGGGEVLSGPVTQDGIDRVISTAKSVPEDELLPLLDEAEAACGVQAQNEAPDLMSWSQINEMAGDGLLQFGSHTRRHRRLVDGVSSDVLHDEIVASKAVIEERLDRPVPLFCYPNGDHCPAALDLVRRHYRAACSTIRGWNTPASDRFVLRRIGMHEDISSTRAAFLGRLSGYL